MPDSSPTFKRPVCRGCYALGTACGHCERCAIDPLNPANAPVVLPGNPGSDWTEQDERELKSDANIPDVYAEGVSGEFRRSQLARLRSYAREILRLRAELATPDADYQNLVAEVERLPGEMSDSSAEQKARDMLDRMGVPDAQHYSSGDVVELANLIANADAATTSVRSPEVEEAGEAE